MQIPLLDLKSQYQPLKDKMISEISEVLDSQICIGGPKLATLEEQVAALSDCQFGVGVSSGTDALLNSMMSLGIGQGDEVITTPFTFFGTVGCIVRLGAIPVFADIDPKTYNIDPTKIEAVITDKTKAIVPVHLFGQLADMDAIMAIAKKHQLFVIEDAAQAIGSSYKGKKAGSFGDTGCFSFYPTKNLGAVGDAGLIVTNDEALHYRLTIMRGHGMDPRYYHKFVGANFRLDAIQAAALLVKLPHLESWSKQRQENAAFYDQAFDPELVVTPYISDDCVSTYHQYCIRVSRRDELVAYLKEKQIGCDIYYPMPLHLQECFGDYGWKKGDYPESEKASEDILAIPIYPELTTDMQQVVVDTIHSFYK